MSRIQQIDDLAGFVDVLGGKPIKGDFDDNFYMAPMGQISINDIEPPPIHCCNQHNECGCSMIAMMLQRSGRSLESPDIVEIGNNVFGKGKENYDKYANLDQDERRLLHKKFYTLISDHLRDLADERRPSRNDKNRERPTRKRKI